MFQNTKKIKKRTLVVSCPVLIFIALFLFLACVHTRIYIFQRLSPYSRPLLSITKQINKLFGYVKKYTNRTYLVELDTQD